MSVCIAHKLNGLEITNTQKHKYSGDCTKHWFASNWDMYVHTECNI